MSMLEFEEISENLIFCFDTGYQENVAELTQVCGKWVLYDVYQDFYLEPDCVRQIAEKLDELNKS